LLKLAYSYKNPLVNFNDVVALSSAFEFAANETAALFIINARYVKRVSV
jgi:hypothetical protein